MPRFDGRRCDQLRPVTITCDFLRHPKGSCLIACGNTRVIGAASLEERVPGWMTAQNVPGGWLTCEYGMLPASTGSRMKREASSGKQGGRTVEIQRLIGRSLRMGIDLANMGAKTINIDCDVIDADGGTRCAGITAGSVALALCCKRTYIGEIVNPFKELVAAVSVGIVNGEPVLDLCYEEDSAAEVDMNVIMSESGKLIEVQGTAEEKPFSRAQLNELLDLAEVGLKELFAIQRQALEMAK